MSNLRCPHVRHRALSPLLPPLSLLPFSYFSLARESGETPFTYITINREHIILISHVTSHGDVYPQTKCCSNLLLISRQLFFNSLRASQKCISQTRAAVARLSIFEGARRIIPFHTKTSTSDVVDESFASTLIAHRVDVRTSRAVYR